MSLICTPASASAFALNSDTGPSLLVLTVGLAMLMNLKVTGEQCICPSMCYDDKTLNALKDSLCLFRRPWLVS